MSAACRLLAPYEPWIPRCIDEPLRRAIDWLVHGNTHSILWDRDAFMAAWHNERKPTNGYGGGEASSAGHTHGLAMHLSAP